MKAPDIASKMPEFDASKVADLSYADIEKLDPNMMDETIATAKDASKRVG